MDIGILTAPFGDQKLHSIIKFAGDNGFGALEIACGRGSAQLDPITFTASDAEAIRSQLSAAGVRISSLAAYINVMEADEQAGAANVETLMKAIDAAKLLGVDTVCTIAGMPLPGKTKLQTIEQDCKRVFAPILDYAAEHDIRIALENWYATNIQSLMHFEVMFQVLPQTNFGLNYDPSHLVWQGIDYVVGVHHFKDRIFHTHAKDTEIRQDRLRMLGCLEHGWWRYVIPGLGVIRWGEYISALRAIGYDGVLSVEHEDSTFAPEPGFLAAKKYLGQWV